MAAAPSVKKRQQGKRRGLRRPPRLFFIAAHPKGAEMSEPVAEFVYCCRTESDARNNYWSDKLKDQGYELSVTHGGYANRNVGIGFKWGKWEINGRQIDWKVEKATGGCSKHHGIFRHA
jgi:hypothetical protein